MEDTKLTDNDEKETIDRVEHYIKVIERNSMKPPRVEHCLIRLYKLHLHNEKEIFQQCNLREVIEKLLNTPGEIGKLAKDLLTQWDTDGKSPRDKKEVINPVQHGDPEVANSRKRKHSKTDDSKKSSRKHHEKKGAEEHSRKEKRDKKHQRREDKKRKLKEEPEEKREKKHSEKKRKLVAPKDEEEGGIDCHSGKSFDEALGFCSAPVVAKKSRNSSSSSRSPTKTAKLSASSPSKKTIKTEPTNKSTSSNGIAEQTLSRTSQPFLKVPTPTKKLEHHSAMIANLAKLPEISPNYKPLSERAIDQAHKRWNDEDKMLTQAIHHKNHRTKVYSGNKISAVSVPSLVELSQRVFLENIDVLTTKTSISSKLYKMLKPAFKLMTAHQLYMVEHKNRHLENDTHELWRHHCHMKFRGQKIKKGESHKEMYLRCEQENEKKLENFTEKFKRKQSVKVSEKRSTIEIFEAKAPREFRKAQAKEVLVPEGITPMAVASPTTPLTIKQKLSAEFSVKIPPSSRNGQTPSRPVKKAPAPLMMKALRDAKRLRR